MADKEAPQKCDRCGGRICWPPGAERKPWNCDQFGNEDRPHNCIPAVPARGLPAGPDWTPTFDKRSLEQMAKDDEANDLHKPTPTSQTNLTDSKVSSPASEEAPKVPKHLGTNPLGDELENSYVNNRRALSLQVWHLAIHDAKVLVGGATDKQLEVAQTLYLGMMSNL